MQTDGNGSPTFFKPITRLLDNIGLAMYSSVPRAIGELVANSYDADAQLVEIIIPDDFKADSTIVIKDDGSGMTRAQIDEEYMVLGYNRREKSKKTPKGRLPIGNKGIGKLAGLGIAEVMDIETVHDKVSCSFQIDKEKLDNAQESLAEIPIPVVVKRTDKPDGTTICLRRILPRAKAITANELLSFLTEQFGLKPDFQIIVNDIHQSAKSYPGDMYSFTDTIDGCGQISGFYVITHRGTRVKAPGFIIRVRGRAVLGPTVFRVFTSGRRQAVFSTGRIIGEINADFLDPEEPQTKSDEFTITTSRDNFNESDPKFLKFRDYVEDKIREIVKEVETRTTIERKKRILENNQFKTVFQRLPINVQTNVLDLINKIIPRLHHLSEEDSDFVLEIILRASESSEFLEILKKMHAAGAQDLVKLAELLRDWGLYEITAITELIKRRLAVIQQFEKFARDIETLEYEQIHKTLESNLWLLDDNYKLYGSNRTLKKILDDQIQKRFKRHENDRPDLICRDLMNRIVIIELKRPKHVIDATDWSQLLQYKVIVKAHAPCYRMIECFLIGSSYDEALRDKELGKIGYSLMSYSEIITGARRRYKEILEILETEREEKM